MINNSYYEKEQDLALYNLINYQGKTNYPPHFHKKTEITYIVKGSCYSKVNNQEIYAEKDNIIYASSYITHSYNTSDDAKRIVLCPPDILLSDFSMVTENKIFPCLLTNKLFNKKNIYPLLIDLLNVHNDKKLSQQSKFLISKGLINIFYGKLYEEYSHLLKIQNKNNENICKILEYIDQNSSEDLKIDNIAKHFGYSTFYFSRMFNNLIEQNFNSYLNNIRIRKFITLYSKEQSIKITNLAFELGFESTTSFYRAFNSVFGCPPSEYFQKK